MPLPDDDKIEEWFANIRTTIVEPAVANGTVIKIHPLDLTSANLHKAIQWLTS